MKSVHGRVLDRGFFYRSWKYFRDGYALYVHYPLGILSYITITYTLLLGALFPNIYVYAFLAIVGVIPISVFFGWLHMRKSNVFGVESVLMLESNPLYVHFNRVQMELSLDLYGKLNLQPPENFRALYEYWRHLDDKSGWKPNK